MEGESEQELTSTVREHFCAEHGMTRPRNIDSSSPMTYDQPSPVGGLKLESSRAAEGPRQVDRPVEQMGTAWKEATIERVECPSCREIVEGCDCEELSLRLGKHMAESHRGEGFMERTKERIKGQ